tara:strand:+ start:1437 stop:1583 length:147 start_codon:yes stop_codon:yes gene_type:complete
MACASSSPKKALLFAAGMPLEPHRFEMAHKVSDELQRELNARLEGRGV